MTTRTEVYDELMGMADSLDDHMTKNTVAGALFFLGERIDNEDEWDDE